MTVKQLKFWLEMYSDDDTITVIAHEANKPLELVGSMSRNHFIGKQNGARIVDRSLYLVTSSQLLQRDQEAFTDKRCATCCYWNKDDGYLGMTNPPVRLARCVNVNSAWHKSTMREDSVCNMWRAPGIDGNGIETENNGI